VIVPTASPSALSHSPSSHEKPSAAEAVSALEREEGPRLGDALEVEDRITPVVRRDALARDDMKIALAIGIAQPDCHCFDPDSHGQLAGNGLQALGEARRRKPFDGFLELGRRE